MGIFKRLDYDRPEDGARREPETSGADHSPGDEAESERDSGHDTTDRDTTDRDEDD